MILVFGFGISGLLVGGWMWGCVVLVVVDGDGVVELFVGEGVCVL